MLYFFIEVNVRSKGEYVFIECCLILKYPGAGEMAQKSRVLAALAEDLSSDPSNGPYNGSQLL